MCYIWVCVAYTNNAQRERYLHAEGMLVIRRAYAQLDARSLRARWYSLCIRTHTLCARYSNVSGTVWERYEHGARTQVPPNLIHTPGKLCVCGLLSYAQRTQNQYANIWRGLKLWSSGPHCSPPCYSILLFMLIGLTELKFLWAGEAVARWGTLIYKNFSSFRRF